MAEKYIDLLPDEYRYSGRTGQLISEEEAKVTYERLQVAEAGEQDDV